MGVSKAVRAGALAAVLAVVACGDFRLAAFNLDVSPDPAVSGDDVVATFELILIPAQQHTIIVYIDEEEHSRTTTSEAPTRFQTIQLGTADELIAAYGTGLREARVEVRAEEANEKAKTQSATFQLGQPVATSRP
jgi:hypothetical protein